MANFIQLGNYFVNIETIEMFTIGSRGFLHVYSKAFTDGEIILEDKEQSKEIFTFLKTMVVGKTWPITVEVFIAEGSVPYMNAKTFALIEHGYTYVDYGGETSERCIWYTPGKDTSFPRSNFVDATQAAFEHLQQSKEL